MIKRLLTLLTLLLVFPFVAHAGPVAWAKRHPLVTKLIVAGAASGVYAEGLHRCRVMNVENCQEHYGAAWAGYGSTVGLNLLGQVIGQKIGGKTGDAIAYGGSAAVLGWGIYQWNGGLNKEEHEAHRPDLHSVVIVLR